MVDIDKVLKNTVKKGKVKIGAKETKATISGGSAKMIIVSNNCPHISEIKTLAKKKNVPIYNYKSNSIDLGYSCGKAYSVSTFAVVDDGGANITQLVKKGKKNE